MFYYHYFILIFGFPSPKLTNSLRLLIPQAVASNLNILQKVLKDEEEKENLENFIDKTTKEVYGRLKPLINELKYFRGKKIQKLSLGLGLEHGSQEVC